jgi:ribonucleoside-triphosphate reductase
MFEKIKKRDGRVVNFDSTRITWASGRAGAATGEFAEEEEAKRLTRKVLDWAHAMGLGQIVNFF